MPRALQRAPFGLLWAALPPLLLLAGAILAAASSAEARRQAAVGRQSVLVIKTRDIAFYKSAVDAFARGLKTRGYGPAAGRVELSVIALGGNPEADKRLVRDQLRKNPRLVVTLGTDATRIVAGENPAAPVLFGLVLDPVSLGVAKSLDNPGGGFSGTTLLVSPGKQIDHLLQIAPKAKRIGVLYSGGDRTSLALLGEAQSEARRLGAEIVSQAVGGGDAATDGLGALARLENKVDAVWLIPDPASTGAKALVDTLAWARAHKLPVLGASSGTVRSGALLALSASVEDAGDVTAEMAVNLLDGRANTRDMRVRGPRRTLLSLNLQAAQQLGLSLPPSILQGADEVVDAKTAVAAGTGTGKP